MGPEQDVVVCSKKTFIRKSNEEFLINIFKNVHIINKILPKIVKLKYMDYQHYVEHFTINNHLYVVFTYAKPLKLKKYFNNQKPSFKEKLDITDSFFTGILSLSHLPLNLRYKISDFDNINVNFEGKIYFSHILDFRKTKEEFEEKDFFKKTGVVLEFIFKNRENIPRSFIDFLDGYINSEYESINDAYIKFNELREELTGTHVKTVNSKDLTYTSDITLAKKNTDKSRKKLTKKTALILSLMLISAGGYSSYKLISSPDKFIYRDTEASFSDQSGYKTEPTAESGIISTPCFPESETGSGYSNTASPSVGTTPALKPASTPAPEYTPELVSTTLTESTPAPVSTPQMGITPAVVSPTEPAASTKPISTPESKNASNPDYELYTVVKGDWLKKISRKLYGNSVYYKEIAELNNITYPYTIEPGQILKVPIINKPDSTQTPSQP